MTIDFPDFPGTPIVIFLRRGRLADDLLLYRNSAKRLKAGLCIADRNGCHRCFERQQPKLPD